MNKIKFNYLKERLWSCLQHGFIISGENGVLYNITKLKMALMLYVLFYSGMLNRALCATNGMHTYGHGRW